MAATGKTPILLYGSTTASNVPVAGNLTNSSDGCEIAINVADKNLFFKDSTNAVNTVPIRQSSASSNGWLSSTDWNTFNNKQPAGTYVTSVTGTAPVVSSGGTTPAISMAAASGSVNGYLTSTDWTTFNSKAPAFTYTSNYIPYGQGTTTPTQSANLTFNGTSLGVGVSAPSTVGLQLISTNNISWQQSATESIGNIYVQYSSVAPTLANGYKRNTSGTDKFVSSYGANWARSAIAADYGAVYIYADAAATVAVGTAITPTEVAKFDSSGNATIKNGNLVIGTSGKGIDFSATAGTGTSELLADYEEGTFTPAIYGTTTAGTGTYSSQVGRYTKIGNRVTYNIYLNWSAHTGTGNMRVSGLPYTSNATSANYTTPSLWQNNIALTAGNVLQAFVSAGVTYIIFYQYATGGGGTSAVPLDTAGEFVISGVYEV